MRLGDSRHGRARLDGIEEGIGGRRLTRWTADRPRFGCETCRQLGPHDVIDDGSRGDVTRGVELRAQPVDLGNDIDGADVPRRLADSKSSGATQPARVAVETREVRNTIQCRCGRRVAETDDHDLTVADDVELVSVTEAQLAIACPACGATVSCAHLADGVAPPADSVTMRWGPAAWLVLLGATYRDEMHGTEVSIE